MTQAHPAHRVSPRPLTLNKSIFRIPAPLKRVFDKFPLVQYAENELPVNGPVNDGQNKLHIFTTEEDARVGRPSYNPGCLKWQIYLHIAGVPFRTVPSSNHASPSGVLPFLLPTASKSSNSMTDAVASNKLRRWVKSQNKDTLSEPDDLRYEAYASLVDNALRKAWLYQLYVHPANTKLAHELYVAPCSSSSLVQIAIANQLRSAAENELTKSSYAAVISEEDIRQEAGNAFAALSELLSGDEWFFGLAEPSMLDASLIAYTHLILDDNLHWGSNDLKEQLHGYQNLVNHRNRMLKAYFS